LLAFKTLGAAETKTGIKKKVVEALDIVAEQLGNTRTVCKKYYVHPAVITLYEKNEIEKYIKTLDNTTAQHVNEGLSPEETVIMKILSAPQK